MDAFPLHQAAEIGNMDKVRQLIEEGVSVDCRDNRERTPLHWAAIRGRYEVAELLISNKCDLNLKNIHGRTPVIDAAMQNRADIVYLLLQHGAQVSCVDYEEKSTLIRWVSYYGRTDLVRRILNTGEADPNAATKHGITPLMDAAMFGYTEVASLLIRAGADVNKTDAEMTTALHVAAAHGQTGVIHLFLGVEGLELNLQNTCGFSPLHFACIWGSAQAVKQLLEAGAVTTLKSNRNGMSALSEGISKQAIHMQEVIRLFVQHGHILEDSEYAGISANPVLRESVLRDVDLCTQSIVDKFNRQSLPALYSIPHAARRLPPIKFMTLSNAQTRQVANFVVSEIKAKTFCNAVEAKPMVLKVLCVMSFIARHT